MSVVLTCGACGGMQGACGMQGGGLIAEGRRRREQVRVEAARRFERRMTTAVIAAYLRAELRAFTSAQAWLRVFRLPAYAPDLNPVEGIWSLLKRGVLAKLAVASFAGLVQVLRHGLKKIQHQPVLIEGCLAGTGLALEAGETPTDITN
jgi:hypothetical protein